MIGDNQLVRLDIAKRKSVGWRPKFTADEAITRAARWAMEEQKSQA